MRSPSNRSELAWLVRDGDETDHVAWCADAWCGPHVQIQRVTRLTLAIQNGVADGYQDAGADRLRGTLLPEGLSQFNQATHLAALVTLKEIERAATV